MQHVKSQSFEKRAYYTNYERDGNTELATYSFVH